MNNEIEQEKVASVAASDQEGTCSQRFALAMTQ
jgi:hypothetical protein